MPVKKMPPRKEVKETVVYPASKRKGPAFKPQRPSKVPRIPTTESESSRPKSVKKTAATTAARKPARPHVLHDDDKDGEDDEDLGAASAKAGAEDLDSDEELADDPLAAISKPKAKAPARAASGVAKRKAPAREASPMSVSSQASARSSPPPAEPPPVPSQSSDIPQIPQNLIIRLLHEHFADKNTKIDKHAIQVLQKYIEVFVREAIARTALLKKEAAEKFDVSAEDAGWLELEDLEKVAPGMMLDF
ncbi:hypothetical protein LTR85_000310 [Meristemomyces frigidus]|nr:hypothetical protein LTR85_000310 [Meristemomyces frigidus]